MSLEYDVNNANLFGILVRPALENGPVVVGTMLACVVIQQLAHILSPFFFKTYSGLTDVNKTDWCIRWVALIHSCFVCSYIMDVIYPDPALVEYKADTGEIVWHHYGSTPRNNFVFSVSLGYFAWDLLICLYYKWPAMYIIHASFCGLIYYLTLFPFEQYTLLFFLVMFEQSTPWLHIRGFMQFCKTDSGVLYNIIGVTFVLVFIVCRIILGSILSYYWWQGILDLYWSGNYHSEYVVYWYWFTDVVLMGLMYYWFAVIISQCDGARDGLGDEEESDKKKK